MCVVTASVLNNFADVALSLPPAVVESTLKQNAAIVDVTGYEGRTALQKAAYVGNLPLVHIFLQYGADPNLRSKTGETAVHVACGRGNLKMVVALLKRGGDPTILDGSGRTAVHCAAMCGSLLMVQYLVEVCEVNLEVLEATGVSPLQIALASGHLNLVSYLVKKKKVNRGGCDNVGNNSLHLGVMSGVSGVCWEVMYPGAEHMLNQKNQNGLTPLMLAKATKTISPDLKKWMDKWTSQYNKSNCVESPRWPYLVQLLLPFVIFHIIVSMSVFATPNYEWLQGLPGLFVLLSYMGRQGHRLKHPSCWPNPIYLGAYTAGLVSTLICFFFILHAYYLSKIFTLFFMTVLASHLTLFYVLLTSDPGVVRTEGPLQEVLRGVGEGVMKGYCIECQLAAPPLSHHCKLCKRCHYNTDHHCLFLNSCIARNNHWHFVIFVATNIILMFGFLYASITITITSSCYSEGDLADCLTKQLKNLLSNNIYTFLMIVFNLGSILWGTTLLRGQLKVIGSQQTTLIRIKCGDTLDKPTWKEWIKNVWTFLMKRKVSFGNQSHYFQQV
ncbi:unnamed protein product, partial [Meganyctiphanes norvegica]